MFDIAVIGAGPGGYVAAEAAAQRGKSVVLFEMDKLGGTCLNRGCIPTKALIHSAEAYAEMANPGDLGICAENVSYDFAAMHARKEQVVSTLRSGIAKLMKAHKVTVVEGHAVLEGEGRISCNGEVYEAADIILAVGSLPRFVPIKGIDGPGVYTSDHILEGDGLDVSSLVIIGGGVIGIEVAMLYAELGAQVTVLEAMDRILPPMDEEIAKRVSMMLKHRNIAVDAKAMVSEISGTPGNMAVTYTDKKGNEKTVRAEAVLVSTGRKPNTDGLLADGVELELDRGAIVADELGRTSIPHVWTIGDCRARTIQLAHVASAQGRNVVAAICGDTPAIDEKVVPSCVYTSPEIASVGMTEAEAKAAGIETKSAKVMTGANGKCLIEGGESGYVKLVADAATDKIIGAQLVCPRATDMIGEPALAVHMGLTASQLAEVIHAHPTVGEMTLDAALSLMTK